MGSERGVDCDWYKAGVQAIDKQGVQPRSPQRRRPGDPVVNVIQIPDEIAVVTWDDLNRLKRIASKHPKQRARLLLHRDHNAHVQEMIICARTESYIRAHRHPRECTESYHLMDGEMAIKIYKDNGEIADVVMLRGGTRFYRLTGGWYHEPVVLGRWAVYHEVFSGPFDKERDVQYAPWAKEETV